MTKITTPEQSAGLPERLDVLAGKTIAAISFDTNFEDLSFGPLTGISKAMRAIETAEGLTLETAARLIIRDEPHYLVAQPGAQFSLPEALIARNGRRTQMRSCYAPDLIVLDAERGHLVIAEFKRSGTSVNRAEIDSIRTKLEAIAPLAMGELRRTHKSIEIRKVDLAVVDCAGRDKRNFLVDLSLFGELLNHQNFASMMLHYRQCFGRHAQTALRSEFGIHLVDRDEFVPEAEEFEPLIRFYERPSHGGAR